MDATDQAAEQIVRMALAGSEVALRLTGAGAKNAAAALMAAAAGTEKTRGKTRLAAMLRTGKELKVFPLSADKLGRFADEAKRYGVLFVVVKQEDGVSADVLVKAEDAAKVNRIIERMGLGRVVSGGAEMPDAAPAKEVPGRPEMSEAAAESLLGELLAAPGDTGKNGADPLAERPEGDLRSEPTSGKAQPSGKAGKRGTRKQDRESVRDRLRAIEHARKQAPSPSVNTKDINPRTPKGR